MARDPFYDDIVKRLGGHLDDQVFEACATDILRNEWPTLVPIPGGDDAGMDGAIAHGEGPAFPLVATTGKDVIRNLERSLRSYIASGQQARRAILATSQALTARRRSNLEKKAASLGFQLVQVYERTALSDRLYDKPHWCRRLLDLTGDPPPLSILPPTRRPLIGETVIGRDADLAWLRESAGDRLIVGQPGAGKTFLLHSWAREGAGLFVVTKDAGRIAEGIRSQKPNVLIVDDAHVDIGFVVALRRLRDELEAHFDILAVSWLGDADEVMVALHLSTDRMRVLDQLSRDEIVTVVKGAGVKGPDRLIRELVNQAEGRPGLAVTLTFLCLQGDTRDVLLGNALARSVRNSLEPIVGRHALDHLAACAMGGDLGVTVDDAARGMQKAPIEVRAVLAEFAAAGVLLDVGAGRLSVRPRTLRHALVRDVFFGSSPSLDYRPFIAALASVDEVARTLIGAVAVGAAVPPDLIRDSLHTSGFPQAWQEYAWLGRAQAEYVLVSRPEFLIEVAQPVLENAPDKAIPLLLQKAVSDHRELHSTPEHPIRLIADWVKTAVPGRGQAVVRRQTLLDSVRAWVATGGHGDTALRALTPAFSPSFEGHTTDPGAGMTLTLRRGYLKADEIQAVGRLWPAALELLRGLTIEDWTPVQDMISQCVYPEPLGVADVPEEVHEAIQALAAQMLHDVATLAGERWGMQRWVRECADARGIEVDAPIDADFEVLFPRRDPPYTEVVWKRRAQAANMLSVTWVGQDPRATARRIAALEREAKSAGIGWPRMTPVVCSGIASQAGNVTEWAMALMEAECVGDLVEPFLHEGLVSEDGRIEGVITEAFSREACKLAAVSAALQTTSTPEPILCQALESMENAADWVHVACLRNELPEHVVGRLLQHDDNALASAAAVGEWESDPEGSVREGLRAFWDGAVLRCTGHDHALSQILAKDASLAKKWLRRRIEDRTARSARHSRALMAARQALTLAGRRELLMMVPGEYGYDELVTDLIGDSEQLYGELLADKTRKLLHLAPLEGRVNVKLAKVAMDAGHTPKEVARAAFLGGDVWTGPESAMWASRLRLFESLLNHEDERVREVGTIAAEIVRASMERAKQAERLEDIYGIR